MIKIMIFALGILIILVLLGLAGSGRFYRQGRKEVQELLTDAGALNSVVTEADLAGLPPCVQKWLIRSRVVGQARISTVHLKQKGLMRTKQDQPWMPVGAEQYFNVEEPGFVWQAKIKPAPLLHLAGRDKYYQGRGHMLIKFMSLFKVVDASGPELDQGALLRYMAEMMWFPTAALSGYLKWEGIDADSARVTMSYQGRTASGVFYFNEAGDLAGFSAKRYMEQSGQFSLQDWSGVVKEYQEFNGIRLPAKVNVIWRLRAGDFEWFQCEITEIEYNRPTVYW